MKVATEASQQSLRAGEMKICNNTRMQMAFALCGTLQFHSQAPEHHTMTIFAVIVNV